MPAKARYLLEVAPTTTGMEALLSLSHWIESEVDRAGGKVESIEFTPNHGDLVIVLHLPDEALLSAILEMAEGEDHCHVVSATPVIHLRELQSHIPELPVAMPAAGQTTIRLASSPELPPDFFRLTISGFDHFSQAGHMLQSIRELPGIHNVVVEQLAHGTVTLHGSYLSPIPLVTRLEGLRSTGAHVEVLVSAT